MIEEIETVITTYLDLCLKFPDENTAFITLYEPVTSTTITYSEKGIETITTVVVEGEFKLKYSTTIDQIGTIYKPTGRILITDNVENQETALLPGWHVNLRGIFTEQQLAELNNFVVMPKAQVRVWA